MNAFDKLTELQKKIGYTPGQISAIALFGLFGEAGEVMEEFFRHADPLDIEIGSLGYAISVAVAAAKNIDDVKKKIRSYYGVTVPPLTTTKELGLDFDKELADTLYYLNAIAINRGKTLEYYADLSFTKVSARVEENLKHGIDNGEMPKEKFFCGQCNKRHVSKAGEICGACEFDREK